LAGSKGDGIVKWLRFWIVAVVTSVVCLIVAADSEGFEGINSKTSLKVLFVSEFRSGEAQEIKKLLEMNNAGVTISEWKEATAERAKDFDLVIIGGSTRKVYRDKVVLDYETAVLGLGPYGCKYFGLLRLKNGHPYT